MDLSFTDEQQALREAVADLSASAATPDRIRELEDDPVGYDPSFWQQLAQMDVLGLTISEEHGGSGMGVLEAVIVGEELGRAIAPSPWFPSCIVGAGLLAAAGSPEQQSEWLPRVARGEAVLTLAWHEADRGDGPGGVQLRVREEGDELVLDGTKVVVPYASSADALLVLARRGDAPEDIDLVLVPRETAGVELEHTTTLSSEACYEVRFSGARVPASARLGAAGTGWKTFTAAMDDALIVAAGWAIGGAERTLDMTVEYAKERVQFGVPIGNFQGVAHPIADVATEVAGARTLNYEAAWARSTGRSVGPLAAMSKRHASEVFRRATRVAHQVYGGIGFTLAIDVQLYFRRAKQHDLVWFGPAALDEVVASAELDGDRGFVGIDAGI